jgi:dCMP deaminase
MNRIKFLEEKINEMENIKIIQEGKLGERPSWDEYFMKIAIAISSRSSCVKVHSGSVIVLDNKIIGTGYNGAPPGIKSCIERGGCYKEIVTGQDYKDTLNTGKCIGVHSEMNALAHLNNILYKGAVLYTTIFPCSKCAKTLLAYNIKKIVFKKVYEEKDMETSMNLFKEAGVEVCNLDMSKERSMDIDFNTRNAVFGIW